MLLVGLIMLGVENKDSGASHTKRETPKSKEYIRREHDNACEAWNINKPHLVKD